MGKAPGEKYKERLKRFEDAIQLKVPDRVPFLLKLSFFAAKYEALTVEEAYYDSRKWFAANRQVIMDLEPDIYFPAAAMSCPGQALEAVDFRQIKWPGHGVSPYHTFQFVEGEYMKADEYDAFIADPSDFTIRTFMPRIYGTLEPLKTLPPITSMLSGYSGIERLSILARPEVASAFQSLYQAGVEVAKRAAEYSAFNKEIEEMGYPIFIGATALAPFDLISDSLRGMRGAMLDMYRLPDKLLEAIEKITPMMIQQAITAAKKRGNPRVFIPLHRGSHGFMSLKQFETFYWPGLKKVLLALINEGLTPCVFWEGDYTSRLEYLTELPEGKILALFQDTDVFKAKEILGDTICLAGNMPVSLLQFGTPEQIKDYSKKLIDIVGKDGGFVMSSNSVLDEADPRLVKVWMDFTKEYGIYRQ